MNFNELKLQWEALESWKKALVVLGISVGVVYLIYMFKLENILTEKENLEKDIQSLSREIEILRSNSKPEKLAELNKKIIDIKKEIQQKKKNLYTLKTIIPDIADVDKILKFTAENVYKANLDFEKFSITKDEKVYVSYDPEINSIKVRKSNGRKSSNEVTLYRLSANLKLAGTPNNLIKYINYLSKSKRFIIIDDVKLYKLKNKIKIDMNISTFYSKGE